MKKIILIISAFFLISNVAFAADGKLRIKADVSGASIFIDGKYKGLTKDEQYTNFLLPVGEYKVVVQKKTDEWDYYKKKIVNLVSGKALRVSLELDKVISKKQKQRESQASKKQQQRESQAFKKSREKYTDNHNGTVSDKTTGLIWKKCSEGQTWADSTCSGKASGFTWNQALDYAGDINFIGHFDWRVPTIKELNTLVFCSNGYQIKYKKDGFDGGYCGEGNGDYQKPIINQTLFPNTPASNFWSSSTNADNSSNNAWYVGFSYGHDYYYHRHGTYHVRLVRGGQ